MACVSPIGFHVKLDTGPMGELQMAGPTLKMIVSIFFSSNMPSIRAVASEYTRRFVSFQKK